jgi:hypothetical protein
MVQFCFIVDELSGYIILISRAEEENNLKIVEYLRFSTKYKLSD